MKITALSENKDCKGNGNHSSRQIWLDGRNTNSQDKYLRTLKKADEKTNKNKSNDLKSLDKNVKKSSICKTKHEGFD